MADNVQQDQQLAPQENSINLAESMLFNNKTLGDIYQGEMNLGLNVKLESPEQFTELMNIYYQRSGQQAPTQEFIDSAYGEFKLLEGSYKTRNFDPYELNGEYDYGKGTFNEQGKLKHYMPNDSFLKSGPTNSRFFYGLSEDVKVEHDQQVAEGIGFVKDQNGMLISKNTYDMRGGTNSLSLDFDEELNSYIWKELGDGELGDSSKIRPFDFLGGAEELRSSWAGSAGRGLFSGAVGKTYQGIAGAGHLINSIASGVASVFSDRTYSEIATGNAFNKFVNEMSNTASSLQRQNQDEQAHFYEGANAFFYGFWDGVGQFLPMIASGGAFGAIGVGAKTAVQLSIAIGSLTVYDLTRNDMISKGYSATQADRIGFLFGSMTHASEMVLAGNLMQRYGVQMGMNMTKRMSPRLGAEVVEEMGGKFMKGFTEKVRTSGLPSERWIANKYANILNRWIRDPLTIDYKSRLARAGALGLRGGVEEGIEEAIEGVGHSIIGSVFNNSQEKVARNYNKMYGGTTFTPDGKGMYNQVNKYGLVQKKVSETEMASIKKTQKFSEGVLSGENRIDDTFNWDEPVLAFMSSVFTMGIMGGMYNHTKGQKMKAFEFAKAELKDPTAMPKMEKFFADEIKKGNIEKEHGAAMLLSLKEQVKYYQYAIQKYNLQDESLSMATQGDKSFMFEYFEAHENIDSYTRLEKAIAMPEDTQELIDAKKEELAAAAEAAPGLTAESSPEEINAKKDNATALIESISTPKQNGTEQGQLNDPSIKAVTSQRFTEKMNDMYAIDIQVNKQARANLEKNKKQLTPKNLAKETKRLINESKPIIKTALQYGQLFPAWEKMANMIEMVGPSGIKIAIEEWNAFVESKQLNDEEFAGLTASLEKMGNLNKKRYDVEVEQDEVTADGKPGKKKVTKKLGLTQAVKIINEKGAAAIADELNEDTELGADLREFIKIGNESFSMGKNYKYDKRTASELRSNGILYRNLKAITNRIGKMPKEMTQEAFEKAGAWGRTGANLQTIRAVSEIMNIAEAEIGSLNKIEGEVTGDEKVILEQALIKDLGSTDDVLKRAVGIVTDSEGNMSIPWIHEIAQANAADNKYAVSIIKGLLHQPMDVIGDPNAKIILAQVLPMIHGNIADKNNPIDGKEQYFKWFDDIDALADHLDEIVDLLTKVTRDHIETLGPKGAEHSILKQGSNSNYRFTQEQEKYVRDFIKGIKQQVAEWRKDDRFSETERKRYDMKTKLGQLSIQHLSLRDLEADGAIDDMLDVDLTTKVKGKTDAIGVIIKDTITKIDKGTDSATKEAGDLTAEDLNGWYAEADEDGQKLIESVAAQIQSLILDAEQMLSGKLDKYLKWVQSNTPQYLGFMNEFEDGKQSYSRAGPAYDKLSSKKNYVSGRTLWDDFRNNPAESFQLAFSMSDPRFDEIDNANFYLSHHYHYINTVNQFGKKGHNEKVITKRDVLAEIKKKLALEKDSMLSVLTHEQINVVVDAVGFLFQQNNNAYKLKKSDKSEFTNMILNSLFVRGYAGSGKTMVISEAALQVFASLYGRNITVAYIVPTKPLRELHEKIIEFINSKHADGKKIIPKFIYLDELDKPESESDISSADIVFLEEGSLLTEPYVSDSTNGSVLKKYQEKYKKQLIIIGDESQTASYVNHVSRISIDKFGDKTDPLTEIFRTGVASIASLQSLYRSASFDNDYKGLFEGITATWKKNDKDGMVGVRYRTADEGFDSVVQSYLDNKANGPSKERMLIIDSYANKVKLLEKYPELTDNEVKTMEYNYDEIILDPKKRDWNVSGLKAEEVYLLMTPETMINGDGYFLQLNNWSENSKMELARRVLMTAVSRATQYVEMVHVGQTAENQMTKQADEDSIIIGFNSGIKTVETQKKERQESRDNKIKYLGGLGIADITPDVVIETDEEVDQKPDDRFDTVNYRRSSVMVIGKEDNQWSEEILSNLLKGLSITPSNLEDRKHITANNELRKFLKKKTRTTDSQSFIRKKDMMKIAVDIAFSDDAQYKQSKYDELKDKVAEHLTKKKNESDKLYAGRIKGLTNTIIASAQSIIDDIGGRDYGMTNNIFVSEEYQGSPFFTKIVGYRTNDDGSHSPIYDIYTINFGKYSDVTEYDQAQLATYVAMAIKSGALVNRAGVIKMNDIAGHTVGSVTHTVHDGSATELIDKISWANNNFNLGITPGKGIATWEEFYEKQRKLESVITEEGEVFARGTPIRSRDGNNYYISDIRATKEDIIIQLKDKKTGQVQDWISSKEILSSDYIKKYEDNTFRPITGALNYKETGGIFASGMFIPQGVTVRFPSKSNFWNKSKNKWLNQKSTVIYLLASLSDANEYIERRFINGEKKYTVYNMEGEKTEVITAESIEIVLNDEQIKEIIKLDKERAVALGQPPALEGLNVSMFRLRGLDIVGVSSPVEAGDPSSNDYSSNLLINRNRSFYDQMMGLSDRTEVETKVEKYLIKAFSLTEKNKNNVILKAELNTAKFLELWDARKGVKSVSIVVSNLIKENTLSPVRGAIPYTFKQFNDNMARAGFKAKVINNQAVNPNFSNEPFKIWIRYTNADTQETVDVPFDTKQIATIKQFHALTIRVNKELKSKKITSAVANYNALADKTDKYVERMEAFGKFRDEVWQETLADRFLKANQKIIKELLASDHRLQQLLYLKQKQTRVEVISKGDSFEEKTENLAQAFKRIEQLLYARSDGRDEINAKDMLYYPAIVNSKNGIAVNIDELTTWKRGIIQISASYGVYDATQDNSNEEVTVDNVEEQQEEAPYNPDLDYDPEMNDDPDLSFKRAGQERANQSMEKRKNAIRQVADIIGDKRAEEILGFNEGMIREKGFKAWAKVTQGMMLIADIGGEVLEGIGRHEAMHYVMDYLMSDVQRNKLYAAAQKEMDRKGITGETKEYLADLFEYEEYQPSTFIGKALAAIKRLMYRIGLYSGDIVTILSLADGGYWKDRPVVTPTSGVVPEISYKVQTPQNEFQSDAMYKLRKSKYGSVDNIDTYAYRVAAPMIINFSEIGKTVNDKNNETVISVDNTFGQANTLAFRRILRLDTQLRNDERKGKTVTYWDEDTKAWVRKPYSKINTNDYLKAVNGIKKINTSKKGEVSSQYVKTNEKFIRFYYAKTVSVKKPYKTKTEDGETIYISGRKLFQSLSQNVFENISMERVQEIKNKGIVSMVSMNIMQERSEISPTRSVSTFFKALVKTTELRHYQADKDGNVVSDSYFDESRYMDFNTMNDILFEASDSIRSTGVLIDGKLHANVNMVTLIAKLKELLSKTTGGGRANYIYTFLTEYGDVISKKWDVVRAKKRQSKGISGLNKDRLSTLNQMTGVGYFTLAYKQKWFTNMYMKGETTAAKSLEAKTKAFRKVISMIEDGYGDVVTIPGGKINLSKGFLGQIYTNLYEYNAQNNTLVRSELRTAINGTHYAGTMGSVDSATISYFHGDSKEFIVDKDGVFIKDSTSKKEKWINIIGIENKNGKLEFTPNPDSDVYYRGVLQMLKFLLVNNRLKMSVVEALSTASGKDGQKPMLAEGVAGMMMKLYSAVLNTESWNDNGKVDSGEIVWAKTNKIQNWDNFVKLLNIPMDFDDIKGNGLLHLNNPNDMNDFLNNHIAFQLALQQEGARDKMIVMDDGNMKQIRQNSSFMHREFGSDDIYDGATKMYVLKTRDDVTDRAKKEDNFETAAVTKEKGKEVEFRNPILNERIKIKPIGSLDSVSTDTSFLMAKDMSKYDYLKVLYHLTMDQIKKNDLTNMPVFMDVVADKTKIPYTFMQSRGTGKLFDVITDKGQLLSANINHEKIVLILDDFLQHDHKKQQLAIKRWDEYSKKVNGKIDSSIEQSDLVEFKDYKVNEKGEYVQGNDIVQSDSPYINIPLDNWNKLKSKGNWEAMFDLVRDQMLERIESLEGIMEDVMYSGGIKSGEVATYTFSDKQKNWMKTLFKNLLSNVLANDLSEARKLTASITEMVNDDFSMSQIQPLISALKNLREKARNKISDPIELKEFRKNTKLTVFSLKGLRKETALNQITEVMFWSHHIWNKSVNDTIRGGVENYSDYSDYVRRGKGFDGPGNRFMESAIGKTVRTLVVSDERIVSKRYGGSVETTDGIIFVNPIYHELMKRAKSSEYGPITSSSQKTMYFNYNTVTDVVNHLKMSMFSPKYDKAVDGYYRSMFKTMWYQMFVVNGKFNQTKFNQVMENEANFNAFIDKAADVVQDELSNDPEYSVTGNKMIGWITMKSSAKDGASKILKMVGEEGTQKKFDPRWNTNNDNTTVLSTNGLRLQNLTGSFVFDMTKPIPTQLSYLIGVGPNNQKKISNLNEAMAEISSIGLRSYARKIANAESHARSVTAKSARNSSESRKLNRLINSNVILDAFRSKAISALVTDGNQYLRPTLPGESLIQVPALDEHYFRNGKITLGNKINRKLTIKDKDGKFGYETKGYKKRSLNPMLFIDENGKEYTSRKQIEEAYKNGKYIRIVPQEVIMPFVQKKEFNIGNNDTNDYQASLHDIFFIRSSGFDANMQSKIDEMHTTEAEMRNNLDQVFDGMTVEQIMEEAIHEDIKSWMFEKESNIVEIIENREIDETDRDLVIKTIADYYVALNKALDVLSVRIPTTNGSSAQVSRIVEMTDDYDNTIFVSPEKNILDGSDYDIDELHIFHRPITKGKAKDDREIAVQQLKIFNAIYSYYIEENENGVHVSKNPPFILQQVSTKPIEILAERASSTIKLYSNDLSSTSVMRDIGIAGTKLVGHYANMQNGISRMLHLTPDQRDSIFGKGTVVSSDMDSVSALLALIETLSVMINAATDNDKLGGPLGKIGFTEFTTPLIAGMIMEGSTLDEIVKVTSDSRIRELDEKQLQGRLAGNFQKIYQSLTLAIKTSEKDDVKFFKQQLGKSYKGEQISRFSKIIRLGKGLDGKEWGIYNSYKGIEEALGMSMADIIEGKTNSVEDQTSYIKLHHINENYWSRISDHETAIRETFSLQELVQASPNLMGFINILNQIDKFYTSSFKVNYNNRAFNQVMQRVGRKKFSGSNESEFKRFMTELEKMTIGNFISGSSTYKTIQMKLTGVKSIQPYVMSNPKDRQKFVQDFPKFIDDLRGRTDINLFVNSLRYDATFGDIPIYKLNNSNGLSPEIVQELAGDFNSLDENDKKIFRLYNALVYGFSRKDGNMSEVIDDKFEQGYSNWMKSAKEIWGKKDYDQITAEIVARFPGLASQSKGDYRTTKISAFAKAAIHYNNKEYNPITTGFSSLINTYTFSKTPTVDDVPFFGRLNRAEINKLKDLKLGKEFNVWNHGVEQNNRDARKKEGAELTYSDDKVFLQGNIKAEIKYIDDSRVHLKIIPDIAQEMREVNDVDNNHKNQAAASVINTIIEKLMLAFPNIDVRFVDNTTTDNPGSKAYTTTDGVVYLNTDLINTETPIHEFGHVYTAILRATEPEIWSELEKAARSLIKNGDPLAMKILDSYPDYSTMQAIDEIIVHIMSQDAVNTITDAYNTIISGQAESLGQQFWNSFKELIKQAWNAIFNTIRSALGISNDVSLAHKTIKDLSGKILSAVKDGQVLSFMSSNDVSNYMFGVQEQRAVINAIPDLFSRLYSYEGETIKESELKRTQLQAISMIKANKNKLPTFMLGEEIEFKEEEVKYNSPSIKSISERIIKQNNKTRENLKTAILSLGSIKEDQTQQEWLDDIFGLRQGRSMVTSDHFSKLLMQIGYMEEKKYIGLKDLAAKLKMDNLIPPELMNENIIVSIDSESDQEIQISFIDTSYTSVVKDIREENLFAGFLEKNTAFSKGMTLKKDTYTLAGMQMAMIANLINTKNNKIKVREIGIATMWSKDKNYTSLNLHLYNDQLSKVFSIKALHSQLGPDVLKYFDPKNFGDHRYNHAIYMQSLWDMYNITGRGEVAENGRGWTDLSLGEQQKVYRIRLNILMEEYIDAGGNITHEQRMERDGILRALKAINTQYVSSNQVNPNGDITATEKSIYDANSIGHEDVIFVRSIVLDSSNRIVANINNTKKDLHSTLNKWMKLHGSNKVSVMDRSKKLWDRLFDKMEDVNGNIYRTGSIYWTTDLSKATNEQERQFIKRAQESGLTPEELKVGEELVDMVEKYLIKNIKHTLNFEMRDKKREVPYTDQDALKELKSSQYYRGWMPMMGKTASEKLAKGNVLGAIMKRKTEVTDITNLFEENPNYVDDKKDEMIIRKIRDNMFTQLGWNSNSVTQYGSTERTEDILGLKEVVDNNSNTGWKISDAKVNNGMSYNIEKMMKYLIVATERNITYETETLPVINGILSYLKDKDDKLGENTKNVIDYIKNYRSMAVLGQKHTLGIKLGKVDVEKTLSTIDMIARPLVLALNLNVAILSSGANAIYGWIDGMSNKIAKNGYYNAKHIAKATKLILSDYSKVSQLSVYYQVASQTEYDMLNHMPDQVTGKKVISDFTANFMSWSTDWAARVIIMTAQMLADGSYDAHTLNKDGQIEYSMKKDRRFFSEDGTQTDEQKAMYKAMSSRLEQDGFSVDGKFERGYDYESARTFKALSDMYVVGSFDNKVAAYISNYQLGRSFLMMSNWFISRFTSALGISGKYKHEGGILMPTTDKNGKVIAKWERIATEGYITTFWKATADIVTGRSTMSDTWDQAEGWQRKNMAKAGITFSLFAVGQILYMALVNQGDEDDDRPIPELIQIKTAGYLIDQLLVVPVILDMISDPFAGPAILGRGIFGLNGEVNMNLLKNWVPMKKTVSMGIETYDYLSGEGEFN